MKINRCKIMIKSVTLAKESTPQWFKDLGKEAQEAYLEEHPNSKIAKDIKAEQKSVEVKVAKKGEKPVAEKKPKKDSYANVPEVDKKVMLAAKERGFTVPPAWRDCWLNPDKDGDLQVKGKDSKGRTQYLYSINFRTQQDALKFSRLTKFTHEYPTITKKINSDLKTSEEAKVLYLISKTGFRIGDNKDTGAKVQAYGASTLTSEHIKIKGNSVSFDFIGKEGVHQQHTVEDPILAKMLKGIEGPLFKTKPAKIHKYLDSISAEHFKVKDFRTYVGTSTALLAIKEVEKPTSKKEYDKAVLEVCKIVSKKLGNTPKMAKDSYIDPTAFRAWQDGIDMGNKEQSSSKAEDEAMIDFIETNHYQFNSSLILQYKHVKSLPNGAKRTEAYKEFQRIAKKLGLVKTANKAVYIKSLNELEKALKNC